MYRTKQTTESDCTSRIDRNVQRHRAVSRRQHHFVQFLVCFWLARLRSLRLSIAMRRSELFLVAFYRLCKNCVLCQPSQFRLSMYQQTKYNRVILWIVKSSIAWIEVSTSKASLLSATMPITWGRWKWRTWKYRTWNCRICKGKAENYSSEALSLNRLSCLLCLFLLRFEDCGRSKQIGLKSPAWAHKK